MASVGTPTVPSAEWLNLIRRKSSVHCDASHRPQRERHRLVPLAVDDFPIHRCEVRTPRRSRSGSTFHTWCTVIGHADDGQLVIDVPDEPPTKLSLIQLRKEADKLIEEGAGALLEKIHHLKEELQRERSARMAAERTVVQLRADCPSAPAQQDMPPAPAQSDTPRSSAVSMPLAIWQDPQQCAKHPHCTRGLRHGGKGGHCRIRPPFTTVHECDNDDDEVVEVGAVARGDHEVVDVEAAEVGDGE